MPFFLCYDTFSYNLLIFVYLLQAYSCICFLCILHFLCLFSSERFLLNFMLVFVIFIYYFNNTFLILLDHFLNTNDLVHFLLIFLCFIHNKCFYYPSLLEVTKLLKNVISYKIHLFHSNQIF